MKNKKLYILTYDHGGYVLWKDAVKPRIKELFEWMEKYPKLRIGLDYESFTFDEFSRCDPEVVQLIKDLVARYPDRVGLGATTYGQPLSMFVSEESNVRQLTYAVRTNLEYFGKTPNVYAISEFALNNQTPQLAKLCGYDAAILRSHVMGYGYPRTFDSAWGKWIGKDGSYIPAVPTYDKQGRGFNCCTVDNWILSRWPQDTDISLEDFEKMFSKYLPLLASRYDDLTQEVKGVTEYIETKENYEYVLLEDIPALFGEPKDELKTTDNDFHIQMPWGYCGNEIFNGCRESEVAAAHAEKLNALAVMLGGESLEKTASDAWKYALAAQHHDVTICGLLDLSRRFIPESLKLSAKVKEKSLEAIESKFASPDGDALLLINPHSFAVDEWVEAQGKKVRAALKPFEIKRIPLDASAQKEKYEFSWSDESGEFVTPNYRLKLTDKGIAYIDKKNGERIFDNGDGELFVAHVDGEDCASQGKWSVEINDIGAVAVQKGKIGSIPYTFSMAFNGGSARIDCKSRFEMHGELVGELGVKEGLGKSLTVNGHRHEGKLCFAMNVCLEKDRKMVRDLPFSISEWSGDVRKTEDYWYQKDLILIDTPVSPEESFESTTYFQGVYWLGMRDCKKGLAVFNRGCMGAAVNGNRLTIPLLYSNEYMCGTRILDGIYEDEFALCPFDSSVSDAQLHKNAMSYNYQPEILMLSKGAGELDSLTAAKLEADGGEVIMTGLYPENGAVFARFCNYSDEAAKAEIGFALGKVTAETDLLGNVIGASDGKLTFRPWEIKTIKIEL